jgi:predicted FMN-binding regulatory protein PaiB
MYHIPYFKAADHQEVINFMQANAFVTICGVNAVGKPVATHIPILIDIVDDRIILSVI